MPKVINITQEKDLIYVEVDSINQRKGKIHKFVFPLSRIKNSKDFKEQIKWAIDCQNSLLDKKESNNTKFNSIKELENTEIENA